MAKYMDDYSPQRGTINILSHLLDMIQSGSLSTTGLTTAASSERIKRTYNTRYKIAGINYTVLASIASVIVGSTYAIPAGYGVKLLLSVSTAGTMVCTRGTAVSAANGGATAAVYPSVPRNATTGIIKSAPFGGLTIKSGKATAAATLGTHLLAAGSLTTTFQNFAWPPDGDSAIASGIL